jgi:hypothetical protein
MPFVVAVGAFVSGVGAITIPLPDPIIVNDVLIIQVKNFSALPIIADPAGGTWTPIGPFNGSHANPGVRGTWWWSRYNGTQTAPTTNDTGDNMAGRMVAVRGCLTTGSPINASDGNAPTFAETVSSINGVITTAPNCLILDGIVGEGP